MLSINFYQSAFKKTLIFCGAILIDGLHSPTIVDWITITTCLILISPHPPDLPSGLKIFMAVVFGLWISEFLSTVITQFGFILSLLLAFLGGSLLLQKETVPLFEQSYFYLLIILIICLIRITTDHTQPLLTAALHCFYGICYCASITRLLVPTPTVRYFSDTMAQILKKQSDYLFYIKKHLNASPSNKRALTETVYNALTATSLSWIDHPQFNPALQQDFLFVTQQLEQTTDLLFSLDQALHEAPLHENTDLIEKMKIALDQNLSLLTALVNYFLNCPSAKLSNDWTTDIIELETTLDGLIPQHLQLLGLSPAYVSLSASVLIIKELRQHLLQVLLCLPSKS